MFNEYDSRNLVSLLTHLKFLTVPIFVLNKLQGTLIFRVLKQNKVLILNNNLLNIESH